MVGRALEWMRARVASLYVGLRYFDFSRLVRPGLAVGLIVLVAWLWKRRPRSWRSSVSSEERAPPSALEELVAELDAALDGLGCARPKHRAPLGEW